MRFADDNPIPTYFTQSYLYRILTGFLCVVKNDRRENYNYSPTIGRLRRMIS